MGLIEKARGVLGGGARKMHTYRCTACGELFDTEETHMARVHCPSCSSSAVTEVV